VAGPNVYICERCVGLAGTVISSGRAAKTELGLLQSSPAIAIQRRCSFCGKRRNQLTGLASSLDNPAGKHGEDAAICSECLTLCREIHAEQLT
jgi:ATP-dependent protease Clp ATPase subunit